MKVWISLGALLLWSGALVSAHASPLPRYEPGQAFVFDNGRVEQVRETDGDKVVWAARSGRTYVRSANPVVPILEWSFRGQAGSRAVLGEPQRLWPLAAGRRVQFRTVNSTVDKGRRSRRSVHLWTCVVRAQERIAVPAGAFSAWPIQCDRFSPNSMRVLERLVWHYSPEVEHYIRRDARDMSNGTAESYRLFAAIPPREANPVRLEALATQAAALSDGATAPTRSARRQPRSRR